MWCETRQQNDFAEAKGSWSQMLLTKMALTDAPGVTLGWVSWGYLMDMAEKVKQFKILLNILLKIEYFFFF